MTARQASRELVKRGLLPHLSGNGVVVSQHPPPGTRIEESTVGRLLLAREPVRLAASDTP
jgi:DNA-binding GntR family transcriptional regulator